MRRIGYRVFLFLLITIFALGLGCDSSGSDNGGGQTDTTTTGYSKADLAGEWELQGHPDGKAWMEFDAQGKLIKFREEVGNVYSHCVFSLTVNPDGSLKGSVCYQIGDPDDYECFSFSQMVFKSKDQISGKLVFFWNDVGSVKNIRWTRSCTLTRLSHN